MYALAPRGEARAAEAAAQDAAAERAEVRETSAAMLEANQEALDRLVLAMSAQIDARMQYAEVRDAGRSLQSRGRKLDIPVPVYESYADRVRSHDGDARSVDQTWRSVVVSEIR
jgi:hypothetical protein